MRSYGHFIRQMPFGLQLLLVIGTALIAFVVLQFGLPGMTGSQTAVTPPMPPRATATMTETATARATATATSTPTSIPSPTSTLLPPKGGIIYAIQPQVNRVGWVISGSDQNFFGESYLYTGFLKGHTYHGAFQFDLSFLTPGSAIHYAAVELTGLDDEDLQKGGTWSLQLLDTQIDPEWPLHAFAQIHEAGIAYTLSPTWSSDDLAKGKTNTVVLNAGERAELERRISRGVVSFRLDGPMSGPDNLFTWDSGYGSHSTGKGPVLRLAVAPPTVAAIPTEQRIAGLGTPTPTYVIVTSEPTPQNMLTAAARSMTATAWATIVGTPTPEPANWVTPIVVTETPTPLNEATASARAMLATAETMLTGTPTATPGNVWTATPTPTFFVITPAPTPENLLTAAIEAVTATAWAAINGTATPLPPNWITPIIVTATPTPYNQATATAQALQAVAVEMLTGTPTPTPVNLWVVTSTPTPMYVFVWNLPPVGLITPTPAALPRTLEGKVGFVSNRRGESTQYVMDATGGNVALFSDAWAYEFASAKQEPSGNGFLSPDRRLIVYQVGAVGQRQIWVMNADGSNPHNISKNEFDEHDPIWLRSELPAATPTPTSAPVRPTATPSQGGRPSPRATSTPKPTPKPPT
jgi:hypothetical protein